MNEICEYDSGSMYGCVPLCDRRSEYVVTYHNGSYPGKISVCKAHLNATKGRVYPGLDAVEPIN